MNLVEKLRQYNRWRRGEEDWPDERGPDPKELGKIIDEAADRIEALEAHNAVLREALVYHRDVHTFNIRAYQLRDAALASTPEQSLSSIRRAEWQPIDTAPKDGTAVLVSLIGSDIPYPARFENGEWHMTWDCYAFSEWDGPTHWMPLPNPPAIRQMED